MMRKTVTCLAALLTIGVVSASAQPFVQAGVAYFFPETDVTPSRIIGGGVSGIEDDLGFIAQAGYKIPYNGLHLAAEFQYFETKAEVATISNSPASMIATGMDLGTGSYYARSDYEFYTMLGTIYYDVLDSMDTRLRMLMGGGMGLTVIIQDTTIRGPAREVSDSTDAFLFTIQGLAGFGWAFTDNVSFDLTYRYTWMDNANVSLFETSTPYRSTKNHSVNAALNLSL